MGIARQILQINQPGVFQAKQHGQRRQRNGTNAAYNNHDSGKRAFILLDVIAVQLMSSDGVGLMSFFNAAAFKGSCNKCLSFVPVISDCQI